MSVDELRRERSYPKPSSSELGGTLEPSAREAVLEAASLSKAYGSRNALIDASLRVCRGEGVALLGPNGSGKTTLLCLLAGVLRADAGEALVLGRSTRRTGGRRALAFVPQEPAVYDGLSAAENVAFFGSLHGLRGAALAASVQRALEAAGLASLARERAGSLSGGMRRRLSLSCALVHAPSLLLLDEPFEGVDDASRDHLLEVLCTAKQQGIAIVLSTHRLHEVGALCERFVLLREGRVVAERAVVDEAVDSATVERAAAERAPDATDASLPLSGGEP
jgi:ABC-2 type transport system ATP-binding protein